MLRENVLPPQMLTAKQLKMKINSQDLAVPPVKKSNSASSHDCEALLQVEEAVSRRPIGKAARQAGGGLMAFRSDAFVFFGATGDLAHKQIFPSLQGLIRDEGLNLPIMGVGQGRMESGSAQSASQRQYRKTRGLDPGSFQRTDGPFALRGRRLHDSHTFSQLREELREAKQPLHYLAIPPSLFGAVAEGLAKSGCAENARVVVEKPFGRDLASAQALNRILHQYFSEERIFHTGSFSGEGTSPEHSPTLVSPTRCLSRSGIATTCGASRSLWQRSSALRIAASFTTKRAQCGSGTDHLLQVLANLTMEPLTGEDRDALRDQKAALLKAVRPLAPGDVVRGQSDGYRSVPGVAATSTVETFVALRVFIETWSWAGVPIYIRAGKMCR